MTPPITICPDHIEHEVHDGFYPKTLWGLDMTLNPPGDDDWTFEPEWGSIWCESEDTVGMRATYRIYTGEDDDEYGSLTLTVPSKGDVYIKLGREGDSDGCDDPAQLRLAGSVLDGGMRKVVDAATQDVWGIFSTVAGGRVTISGYGKRLYVYGICFRPDAVSEDGCIATEAWYREWMNCANDNVQSRYRCYVTGMGVTKFGDKTTLVCHPNDGEVFDHWEFVNCTAPKDATINDIELSFTASQALYDEVGACSAGLRTVIVRPVLKPRRTIMIQTNPCGAAAVSGNGAYFKGEKATVVLDPVDGCIFRGWSDGDKSGLTRVFDIGDRDIVVSALFDGVPVYAPTVQTIIPGDKVDIYAGFIGYTAKGLPSGLKYDKTSGMITGAATKPTAAEGVVVTFRKTGEPNETLTVVVGPIPTVDVRMEGVNSDSDIQGCKVTGAKAYLVGAKVTLKATAPKGTAFVGWFDGETAASKQSSYVFTMGKENVVLVAKFEKEVIEVDSGALAEGVTFPAGVLGAEGGMKITADAPSGVKSIAVSKLPAGMKFDAKNGNVITGAPTKPGDYTVQVKVTSNSGAVETRDIKISVAAMPETAVGTFSGFVANGESRIGTLTLTATDAGKLTAKVATASGTVSFSGKSWDSVDEEGVYRATLTTKKGETLTLALDSTAAWDANQLTGAFSPPNMAGWFDVSAQRKAFAQKWYFDATGNANDGWSFSFAQNAKAAALTVTLKADGSTAIAGMLPNGFDAKNKPVSIKVSASGYANVGAVRNGAIRAGFVPVVKVGSEKKALSISTNLWFDRGDNHEGGAGSAVLAD